MKPYLAILLGGLALTLTVPALAQMPGRGMGMPNYDTTKETTVTGTVQAVNQHTGRMGGMMTGTHLTVETGTGAIDVHVGPTRWLADHKYEFAVGDRVEIVGARVTIDNADAIIAREITKNGQTIQLRNEAGRPLWAGRGRMGF